MSENKLNFDPEDPEREEQKKFILSEANYTEDTEDECCRCSPDDCCVKFLNDGRTCISITIIVVACIFLLIFWALSPKPEESKPCPDGYIPIPGVGGGMADGDCVFATGCTQVSCGSLETTDTDTWANTGAVGESQMACCYMKEISMCDDFPCMTFPDRPIGIWWAKSGNTTKADFLTCCYMPY